MVKCSWCGKRIWFWQWCTAVTELDLRLYPDGSERNLSKYYHGQCHDAKLFVDGFTHEDFWVG